jgi:hypothetical protein
MVALPGMTFNEHRVITPSGRVLSKSGWPTTAAEEGLRAWPTLPEADRKPKELPVLKEYPEPAAPPANGLVMKTYVRALLCDKDGKLQRPKRILVSDDSYGWAAEPQTDTLWLTEADWKALIPASAEVGVVQPVPEHIVERIVVFHLRDKALGCAEFFSAFTTGQMNLTVREVTKAHLRMELNGEVDAAGFPVWLQGVLVYDRANRTITRFDMLAMDRDNAPERPQPRSKYSVHYDVPAGYKQRLAVVFEKVDPTVELNRVPPYAIMYRSDETYARPYFKKK